MPYDARFGPDAQTPAQRAQVLRQMQAANPAFYAKEKAGAQPFYARYVAGELTWAQVRAALDAAA